MGSAILSPPLALRRCNETHTCARVLQTRQGTGRRPKRRVLNCPGCLVSAARMCALFQQARRSETAPRGRRRTPSCMSVCKILLMGSAILSTLLANDDTHMCVANAVGKDVVRKQGSQISQLRQSFFSPIEEIREWPVSDAVRVAITSAKQLLT